MKKVSVIVVFLCFFVQKNYSQQSKIDSVKTLLIAQKDTLLIESLNELSWYYKNKNADSAYYFAKKALRESKKINKDRFVAKSYHNLASAFEAKSELDSAIYCYKRSLKITKNDSLALADTYNNLGIVHELKGYKDVSLNYYFKSLRLYESVNASFEKTAMVLVNIGVVYKNLDENEKALSYYKKALRIYKEDNHVFGVTVTQGNIGALLLKMENYIESIHYSNLAMKAYKELKYDRYVPYALSNIAIAKDSLKEYKVANKLYLKSIKQQREFKNDYEVAHSLYAFSKSLFKQKRYKESFTYGKETVDLCQKKGFDELLAKSLVILSKNYAKDENFSRAYASLKKHNGIRDSLVKKERVKTIYELEAKYQTEKKEKELLLTKTAKAETELKLTKQTIWMYGLSGSLLLFLFGGYAYLQRNKRKHQSEKHLAVVQEKEAGLQAVIQAEEHERSRIAKELHDGIVQNIGSVILGWRDDNLGKKNEKLLSRLEIANQELRNVSHQLMPKALEELGLVAALGDMVQNSLSYTSIKYDYEHFNVQNHLPKKVATTVYRIAQELVQNVIKHSKATEVSIQLFQNKEHLIFIVEDNGKGFLEGAHKKKGIGLLNIKSRIAGLSGSVNFEPSPNSGTLVTVKIPI